MKSYFTQLARNTGLRFSVANQVAARHRFASQRAFAAGEVTADKPLDVEEVTFVSPAPSTRSGIADPVNQPIHRVVKTPATTRTESPFIDPVSERKSAPDDVLTTEVSATEKVVEQTPEPAINQVEHVVEHGFSARETQNEERQTDSSAPAELFERVELAFTPVTDVKVADSIPQTPAVDDAPSVLEENEVEFTDPVDRELLVRQYLREVRAWVSASPTPDDEQNLSSDVPVERVTYAVARDANPPSNQTNQTENIDVQDLSLSIGSISIVVEEPRPTPPAVIAPPPTSPATRSPATSEPTSLSRYYLRSW